mgnify:CR=1 FL=1
MRLAHAVTLVAAAALACGRDVQAPSVAEAAGSYSLTSMNGQKLPLVVVQDPDFPARIEVASGTLHLYPDSTFTDIKIFRVVVFDEVAADTAVDRGTWLVVTRNGQSRIEFQSTAGFGSYFGQLSGHTLVYAYGIRRWARPEQYAWQRN